MGRLGRRSWTEPLEEDMKCDNLRTKRTYRFRIALSVGAGILFAALIVSSTAFAQRMVLKPSDSPVIDASKDDPYLPYGGVKLSGGEPPSPKTPPAGYQYINWPGFRYDRETKTTEVFLQLTGSVTYQTKFRRRSTTITMDNAKVYLRNNFRPVITRHFPGPVSRFRLRRLKSRRHKGKIRLEIRQRRRVQPQVALRTIGQYTYLVVAYPAKRR